MYAQRFGLDELKAEIFVGPARDTHDFVRLKQLDVENAPLLRLITRKERDSMPLGTGSMLARPTAYESSAIRLFPNIVIRQMHSKRILLSAPVL